MAPPPPPPSASTSRAWVWSARGEASSVLSLASLPAPTLPPPLPLPRDAPQPEEWILVRVAFAGLNVGSLWQMTLVPAFLRKDPCTAEMDLSGEVVDVWHPDGDSSSRTNAQSQETRRRRFKRGDGAVAMLPASHALATGTGALAELVAIPARYAVPKPEGVSYADAAGYLLTGMTAAKMVDESGVAAGHRVLVVAASGGIGTMVVQMVRRVVGDEGYIVGVCSGKNAELVRSLGADEIVDYTQHGDVNNLAAHLATRFSGAPPFFDTVIDTLGFQALYLASPAYLAPGGNYSSVGIKPPGFSVAHFLRAVWTMKLNEWWPTSRWLLGAGRAWRGVSMMSPTLADRERVVGMLARGEVRVVRDGDGGGGRAWAYEDAREAYAHLAKGHARGKVLVRVNPEVGDDEC
ncbi:2-methylene-furan-3-one reductase [Purpureocillium takamizusanense]|uniref:2-methylene-furan-3-one reductase n=1 Tax=Purpureocillium takamizusanense TaxID=2060973 RepID=A0A9Q8VAP0_9HYPO|nr:2-methylene-furan-3-one reductase [Purpureocillium takamizusanense]UNI19610.1 2-methylene-furan-3-one reductase [Purpureocillium takamizusanense]